jgi:hypothetical protein
MVVAIPKFLVFIVLPKTELPTDSFRVLVTSVTNFHKVHAVRFSQKQRIEAGV